jgi:hypothetical protein
MILSKTLRFNFQTLSIVLFFAAGMILIPLTSSCSAVVREISGDESLKILRDLTKNGKLPPESIVLEIENRYANAKTGALAKLLRARIKFESGDFAGAAAILNADVFAGKTNLGDYALWLCKTPAATPKR